MQTDVGRGSNTADDHKDNVVLLGDGGGVGGSGESTISH
jgi:hypothetical protein